MSTAAAACACGMKIAADADLGEVADKRLKFRVAGRDQAGLIGEGSHERAIIDLPGFMGRLAVKPARAAITRRSASPPSSRRGVP